MEIFAYRLGIKFCGIIPFHFPPCSTTDARMMLGYFLIAAAIGCIIVAFFYSRDRPLGGR